MNLRVIVTLTNTRQIDLSDVSTGIHPGDLKTLIFAAAKREFGEHDEMRIVSMEEIAGDGDPGGAPPSRLSTKWARALAVADRRPDLFPASVTLSRDRLYNALEQQGYTWDRMVMDWMRREEAPHAPPP